MISATVLSVEQATPTVKVITIATDSRLEFLPGQWVDCYVEIDGSREIGGYSMTSSPLAAEVELAIKRSEFHPVTRFLHEQAAPGTRLELDGGYGDCYYEDGTSALVLIAGGIGITPLMSIIRYTGEVSPDLPVTLFYSAASPDEHVFREELESAASGRPRFQCEFVVSRGGSGQPSTRIDAEVLRMAMDPEAVYFVCGPTPMIDSTVAMLDGLGVPEERVRFERW